MGGIWYPSETDNQAEPLLPAEYVMDPYNQYGFNDIGLATTPSTVWEGYQGSIQPTSNPLHQQTDLFHW